MIIISLVDLTYCFTLVPILYWSPSALSVMQEPPIAFTLAVAPTNLEKVLGQLSFPALPRFGEHVPAVMLSPKKLMTFPLNSIFLHIESQR